MSSVYSVLCLSHDPAIIAAYDCGSPEAAETAIANGVDEHRHCDLIIGRFSYPLVEAGCPRSKDQPADLRCCHGGTAWMDADILRLLDAAYRTEDPAVRAATKGSEFRCWTPERLKRLRRELGITVTKEQPAATAPSVAGEQPACAAYVPPTSPGNSGLCANCGMYDWRHAPTSGSTACRPAACKSCCGRRPG